MVAVKDARRRVGDLDGGEGLEDVVGVGGAAGHDPGVALFQEHHLALDVKFGAAGDDVADGLVISPFGEKRELSLVTLVSVIVPSFDSWLAANGPLPPCV